MTDTKKETNPKKKNNIFIVTRNKSAEPGFVGDHDDISIWNTSDPNDIINKSKKTNVILWSARLKLTKRKINSIQIPLLGFFFLFGGLYLKEGQKQKMIIESCYFL